MTKSELKSGYLVKYKNGDMRMVVNIEEGLVFVGPHNTTTNSNKWHSLYYYDDNMVCDDDELTIVEVYGYAKYAHAFFNFSAENRKLLWQGNKKKKYTYAQLREILGEEFEVVG